MLQALLTTIQSGASESLRFVERESSKMSPPSSPDSDSQRTLQLSIAGAAAADCIIPLRLSGNRVYLSRHVSYTLSGLYDKVSNTLVVYYRVIQSPWLF